MDHDGEPLYTIELRILRGEEQEIVKHHTAKTPEDAEAFVDALRDTWFRRHEVTWQTTEVNAEGNMYGLAPGGTVYAIMVIPPLIAA